MFVKMTRSAAGPEFAASADQIVEVDDKFGRELIDDGAAVEARVQQVEYTTTFHPGLTAIAEGKKAITTPPNPDMSQAREVEAIKVEVIDRRTADEVAADARRAKIGPVAATGPVEVLTSDEQAALEVEAKVATAAAAVHDSKADDSAKVRAAAKDPHAKESHAAKEPTATAKDKDKP